MPLLGNFVPTLEKGFVLMVSAANFYKWKCSNIPFTVWSNDIVMPVSKIYLFESFVLYKSTLHYLSRKVVEKFRLCETSEKGQKASIINSFDCFNSETIYSHFSSTCGVSLSF